MASYSRGILYISINGKQRKIHGLSKRDGERLGEKAEQLKAAKVTGEMPAELTVWAKKLETENPNLFDKLAGWGLLPEREKPKTLGLLVAECVKAKQMEGLKEQTLICFQKSLRNLTDFFGEDTLLESIDETQAVAFKKWLLETPLNRRQKKPACYSPYNVERRLGSCKEVFRFGVRLGWIQRNPLDVLKGCGFKQAPENREQVEMEDFTKAVENAPLKWRVIMCLGRLAGTRGQSELAYLQWGDVRWSETNEQGELIPGSVALTCTKNARHGRGKRVVPLAPMLEAALRDWYFQANENEQQVFPGMTPKTNLGTMVEKVVRKALGYCWREPWYSLRKSWCSDLLGSGIDPVLYEYYADHQMDVSMQHYQTLNASRLERGNMAFQKVFGKEETPAEGFLGNLPNNHPNVLHKESKGEKPSGRGGIRGGYGVVFGVARQCRKKHFSETRFSSAGKMRL